MKKLAYTLQSSEDIEKFADCAARSSINSPLFLWLGNGTFNYEGAKAWWRAYLNLMKKQSLIYADSEDVNAFVVWKKPGRDQLSVVSFIRSCGSSLVQHFGPSVFVKLFVYMLSSRWERRKCIGDASCWELSNISVPSEPQKSVLCKSLLAPILERCRHSGMPVYLSTEDEAYVPTFLNMGFSIRTSQISPTQSNHWSMVYA